MYINSIIASDLLEKVYGSPLRVDTLVELKQLNY